MTDPKQLVAQKVEEELFNTKEKKERSAVDLQSLLAHPGWIILERILKYNADANAQVILDNENLNKEEESELRKDRIMFLFLKTLPLVLARELMAQASHVEPNDDPYEENKDDTIDNGQ